MRSHIAIGVSLVLMLLLSACRPPEFEIGGGGSIHIPPQEIIQGRPTILELELSVSGEGSGSPSNRYKDVRCHYRVGKDAGFAIVNMTIKSEKGKSIILSCMIPPQQTVGSVVEYYFDMMFDGHYNKRDGGQITISPADGHGEKKS